MSTSKRKFNANEDKVNPKTTPEQVVSGALASHASNLWGELAGKNSLHFRSVTVSRKPDGSYLGIARCTDSVGGKWVAFGSSHSAVGALLALSKAIGQDAWKEDKYP